MDSIIDTFESLLSLGNEFEWFDFKRNWFSKDGIGEYISALSNGAALAGKEWGYLLWGVEDTALQVVGTDVNLDRDIDGEPYKHYLARNLKPSIPFTIETFLYEEKRIVMMRIPAAKSVETRFRGESYFRLGSSKEKVSRFPEWGLRLASVLNRGYPTITNVPAPDYIEDLTFQGLFMYYGARGLELRKETFEKTLRLRTPEGEWNVLAYILSDQNAISIRVSVFSGTKKYDPLFSVKEFGNKCILYSLDQLLEYGDAINIAQADERGRISERKDIPLFDIEAFREAVLNAFVHGKWLSLLGPTLSIFTDRIEIVSVGGLAPEQTKKGFLDGASIPVNESLASLFLQLRLSERSGRGVPKIVRACGENAIRIEQNYVKVTIPFQRINLNPFRVLSEDGEDKKEDGLRFRALTRGQSEVLRLMEENPGITVPEIARITGLSFPGIYKIIRKSKEERLLMRLGSRKSGSWKVMDRHSA